MQGAWPSIVCDDAVAGPSLAADDAASDVPVTKDLTAVIALQGLPCGQVVSAKQQAENDYIVSCQDGNRYRVFVNADGRVVVEKTIEEPYSPSSSPTGLRSSTRSQTALTIMMMGTPSSRPHTPHSQPQNSTPTNTATAFIRLARPVSQGVSR